MTKSSLAKITSFLLVLTMVLCMIPMVSAAETDEDGVVYEGTTLVSADKNIEGVYIVKDGTTKIADNAFKDCDKLTTIIFSRELVSLGAYAFDGCENLEYIRTYDNITNIAGSTFGSSADNVCVICRKGTLMQEFVYNKTMTSAHPAYTKQGVEAIFIDGYLHIVGFNGEPRQILILPTEIDGYTVTNIFPGAFRESDTLEYISLGTIGIVGESAFENCKKLHNVDILNEDIIIKENAFKNTPIADDPLNNFEGVLYIDNMAVYADKDIEGTTSSEDEPSDTDATTPDEQNYLLGDVNRDGKLNIRDATLIQKYLAKIAALDDEQMIIADITLDKKVNIKDATYIQKKIANII